MEVDDVKYRRVRRELNKLAAANRSDITVSPKDDSLSLLQAIIMGPPNTPYENGRFKLELTMSNNYPFDPPTVRFVTRVYHPNIDESGRICMDLLSTPPNGTWSPGYTIESLLVAIQMLLEGPNADDPLRSDVGDMFKRCKDEFDRIARRFTQMYAI